MSLLGAAAIVSFAASAIVMLKSWDSPPTSVERTVRDPAAVVPDEIVVDLVDDISLEQIAQMNAQYGIRLEPVSKTAASKAMIMVIKTSGAAESQALLEKLRQDPRVQNVGPQQLLILFKRPNDPRFSEQWNFAMIGMETAWEYSEGKGAVVAVIDSGAMVQPGPGSVKLDDFDTTAVVAGYDFVEDDPVPQDVVGHGTHVAGTIAQATNNGRGVAGVAPQASIMPIRAGMQRFTSAAISESIRFAADHGAHVINLSLGSDNHCPLIEDAVNYAYGKGVFVAAAAGNSSAPTGYPAALPNAFAVSAVADSGQIASYSNRGPEIDIAAPGGEDPNLLKSVIDWSIDLVRGRGPSPSPKILQQTVRSNGNALVATYEAFPGTSMACPHVSGTAALLWSLGVKAPDEIRSLLRRSAKPKNDPNLYGAGLLDAGAAVRMASRMHGLGDFHRIAGGLLVFLGVTRILGRGGAPGWMKRHWRLLVAGGVGLYFPEVVLGYAGVASRFNLIGHSAVVPLLLISLVGQDAGLRRLGLCFGTGVALNLLIDVLAGVAPFNVLNPGKIRFWMLANLAVMGWLFLKVKSSPTTDQPPATVDNTPANPAPAASVLSPK
jgi:serine protease